MADIDAKKIELLPCPFCNSQNVDPEGWKSADNRSGPACDDCCGSADSIAQWNTRPREALATLSLAGEDAGGLCAKLEKVDHFEDRMSCYRNPDGPEAAALIRSLSLRVEAEKRAREEALEDAADKSDEIAMLRDSEARWIARIAVVRHATGDNGRMMLPEFTKWFNARWAELLAAESHSAALARALEEARDELLECKADYHRNPSSIIDKCNAALAEARSLLAPKEDTANG